MANVAPRFSPSDSIILLVDHQTMTIDWVKSLPKTTVIASCRVSGAHGHHLLHAALLHNHHGRVCGANPA